MTEVQKFVVGKIERRIDVPSPCVSLTSGACAGAMAKTLVAPLDRIKIIFQVSQSPFTYRKAWEILCQDYKRDGIFSWWRSNSATMMRIVPLSALQYTAHEQMKQYLAKRDTDFLPRTKRFLSGSFAGVFAILCVYPLEMVRARMAITGKGKYKTVWNTFQLVYRHEGIRTFYNGLTPTVLRIIPYSGMLFYVYESLKQNYYAKNPDKTLGMAQRFLYGALSGACGHSISYPLEVIRRRQQTDGVDGKGYKYRNLVWTIKYIYKTEGIRHGFFKGLSLNLVKGPIGFGASFAIYDTIRRSLHTLEGKYLVMTL